MSEKFPLWVGLKWSFLSGRILGNGYSCKLSHHGFSSLIPRGFVANQALIEAGENHWAGVEMGAIHWGSIGSDQYMGANKFVLGS